MKRKLLLGLVIGLILLGAGIALILWQANALIATYKPQIEQQASQALATPVSIGALELKLFPSIALRASAVALGTAEGAQQLKLEEVRLRVALGALFSGRVQVQELLINQPLIELSKRNGVLIIPGIAPKAAQQPDAAAPAQAPTVPSPPRQAEIPARTDTGTEATAVAFELENLSIRNGQLRLDDQDSKQVTTIEHIELAMGLRAFGKELQLSKLNASAQLPGSPPMSVSIPHLRYDLETQELKGEGLVVSAPGLKLSTDLELASLAKRRTLSLTEVGIDLKPLAAFAAQLNAEAKHKLSLLEPVGSIKSSGRASSKGALYEAQANINLQQVGLKLGQLVLSQLNAPLLLHASSARTTLDAQTLSFNLNQQSITCALAGVLERQELLMLQKFNCNAFGGKSKLDATYALGTQQAESSLTLTDLNLTHTFEALAPALTTKIRGTLSSFEANLKSVLGPQVLPLMKGNGKLRLVDGSLLGVNLAAETLRSVSKLPFLSDSLFNALPKELQQELSGDETEIKALDASFKIANARILVEDLKVESKLFSLRANGWVSFAQELEMNAAISFSPALSKSIVAAVKELSSLQEEDGRLKLQITIKGQLPKPLVIPDPVALLNRLGRGRLEKQAGKLLDKALGSKGGEKGAEIIKGIGDLFRR